ncbi:MAG: hypothetical protein LBI04_04825, partial [Treponema sp.]|nr:hypothetical protein [Treponema sp.]
MKIIVRIVTLISLVSVFLFTTCDNPMGMGKPIDLEPPSIIITGIILPDGSEMTLQEEDNKLFIGPVILEGPGFFLKGTAYDNELVTEIIVEETGTNAEIVDGKPRRWTNAVIGARKSAAGGGGGEQDWRISLDGISNGERNIRVTVYDFPRNTGPDSVKQLTLLIDTEPPFVEKVYIERQPGITAQLMSLALLEGMDPTQFQHIDYFQNEKFTIRASIEHDFSLSGVTLNLLDSDGNELFTPGLERTSGTTEYAPSWLITADQLIAANPVYAGGGPHYLKVSITARAEAGHSGEYEDKVNFMFNLCWYPDADIPQIQMTTDKPEAEPFRKGDKISLRIFDDDNIGEVYAAMIKEVDWEDSILESIDDEKFQELIIAFSDYPELNENRLSAAVRNTVIEIDVPDTRGNYRLVVLAKDKKDSGDSGVWAAEKYDIKIVEEGIPIITITSPLPNISPLLANGENFTIKGTVQNLDDLDEIKIAWIPAGAGLPTNTANAEGEKALLSGDTDTFDYGIKIWKLPLEPGKPSDKDPQKKSQDFSKTFDIFTDFMYEGDIENETKFFILYVQGKDGDDVFESIRFMAYKKPPVLVINSPQNFDEFPPSPAPGSEIYFDIESSSANGMEIDTVTISFIEDGTDKSITLDIVAGKCTWTHSRTDKNEYSYRITSTDKLGISKEEIRTIIVKTLPVLTKITSPHNSGVVFSGRDTITIQAVFDDIVTRVVSTGTETGTPRLLLGGLTTTDNQPRYAYYADSPEPNSTTLNFVYTIQPGDYTGALGPSNGLQVTALQLNDGTISAEEPFTITSNDLLNTKWLNVDARAPTITKIELTGEDGDDDYPNWFRAGATLKAELTIDKEIRVLGTPKLELQFNGSAIRYASYVKMSGTKIMVFEYKIQQGDEAEPVVCDADTCFSGGDLQMITDKIGSNGNFLLIGTPSITGTVYVDAVPPLAPEIIIDNTQSTNNSKTIQIKPDNVESTATKQYTTDNWLTTKTIGEGDVTDWTNITDPYTLPPINQSNNYLVIARQIDRAGNVSPDSDIIDIEIGGSCDIIAILCDNPNGAYPAGSNLTFKLAFSG